MAPLLLRIEVMEEPMLRRMAAADDDLPVLFADAHGLTVKQPAEGLGQGRHDPAEGAEVLDVALQRIAVEESPHGIPLLFGRDVIHGFRTVMPIPLGQAATWNPELVRKGARVAALEAASVRSVSAGGFDPAGWAVRAFRAPHHSASAAALADSFEYAIWKGDAELRPRGERSAAMAEAD